MKQRLEEGYSISPRSKGMDLTVSPSWGTELVLGLGRTLKVPYQVVEEISESTTLIITGTDTALTPLTNTMRIAREKFPQLFAITDPSELSPEFQKESTAQLLETFSQEILQQRIKEIITSPRSKRMRRSLRRPHKPVR